MKLKNIFPKGTHEDKVVLPVYFDNKPMPGEKAACTILWKNKSVEAYRQDRRDTTDKNSGFSVSIFTSKILCVQRLNSRYRTRAIITRGLYSFYPLFEAQKRFFKGLFS